MVVLGFIRLKAGIKKIYYKIYHYWPQYTPFKLYIRKIQIYRFRISIRIIQLEKALLFL